MPSTDFPQGGYQFVPGVFQYSTGVRALDGFSIERVMFRAPVPLVEGFQLVEAYVASVGRPMTAFCACELRSPEPMSETAFRKFNEAYVNRLADWGLVTDGANPVARSNVCPELSPPAEPSLHAFCYTVDRPTGHPSFVIAGSGEVPEGRTNYHDHIISPGDTSPSGLRAKARYVLGEMEARLAALDLNWRDTTATQVYTLHDLHPFLADEIVARGAAMHGLTWHHCQPPIVGLDYEMDCRGIDRERVI